MTAIERAEAYLRQLATHVKQRQAAQIIRELIAECRELTGRKYPQQCSCCGSIEEAHHTCPECGCELEGPCG